MEIQEAIKSRKSVRAFTKRSVPRETIEEILTLSQRAPSGTNTQPWYVYVCTGAVSNAISNDVLQLVSNGDQQAYEQYEYYPDKWNEIHKSRRRGVGWALYGLLGIKKGDREASAKQGARNFQFFDAPVGLFFTTDSYLGRGSWTDVGLYMQTVMLAARAFGLHTCAQAAWIPYQEPVKRHLKIPLSQSLVSGMSLGYADENAIENTLVSEREDLYNVVKFVGFE